VYDAKQKKLCSQEMPPIMEGRTVREEQCVPRDTPDFYRDLDQPLFTGSF